MPSQTRKRWETGLQQYFELDLPHLSAYALTVEPKTALDQMIRKKKTDPVDDQKIAEYFRILQEMTSTQGYIHYEISNFAREGFYSSHNSIYWLGGYYLGLGPSAHSFNGHSRQWNVSSVSRYIQDQDSPNDLVEVEYLTEQQRYNEYVMTSLRTIWGCDLEHIENVFGGVYREHCLGQATPFLDDGKLEQQGNKLFLTPQGKIFADGIAAAMFWG
jgi:oxygen-independent coproporphyrinogen-3 oxidase